MVDRAARNQAAEAIEAYLDDRITAFDLDERLAADTEDALIAEVADLAWCHYDDCKDHQVVMTSHQWNLFQRLLLLLKSDAEINAGRDLLRPRKWEWDHQLACAAFIIYCLLAVLVGWNGWLLVLGLPFAAVAWFIDHYRKRTAPVLSAAEGSLFPFATLSELRRVRAGITGFSKRRYRQELGDRRVRGELMMSFYDVLRGVVGTLLSPLMLMEQMLPTRHHEVVPWPIDSSKDKKSPGRLNCRAMWFK